jgi:hypothetical protein
LANGDGRDDGCYGIGNRHTLPPMNATSFGRMLVSSEHCEDAFHT